jgi:energy-coupling factor transporter ATP-binding protein EcfA2
MNGFLNDKSISFKLSQGFSITNALGQTLTTSQLSSGEQQLFLLFCYVMIRRDKPSVFMIDEPEISLNVKWQRKLVQSLLDLTSGSPIQFLFASHSIELLAQHEARVVRMENIQ